jgi:transposase-like protein
MAGLIAPHHQDERAARVYLEQVLWPDGPVCPKCGVIDEAYRLRGETTRDGLYKCAGCRAPFTVTMGTIFEDSHIPLHKWLLAIYLMCSSKKGMSAHQLWRNLWGVDEETGKQKGSYKTVWFMAHRIRWALGKSQCLADWPVSSRSMKPISVGGGGAKTIRAPVHKKAKKTYRSGIEFGARERSLERRRESIRTAIKKSSFPCCNGTAICDQNTCRGSPLKISDG